MFLVNVCTGLVGVVYEGVPFQTAGPGDPAIDLIGFAGRVFGPLLSQGEEGQFRLIY